MTTRRHFLTGLAGCGLAVTLPAALGAQAILNDDGLYTQPWFLESFLHLAEDLEAAAAAGKRLAIIWELKGCPSCKDTHLVNFADPGNVQFVRERFEVLQLNIIGSREVTDFDGEKLPEKSLAQKYGVRFTPTFQFFPPTSAGLDSKPPRQREVARAQGYLPPRQFQAMFRFVAERAYEETTLSDYLKERA